MQRVTEYLQRFLHLTPRDRGVKEVAHKVITDLFPGSEKENITTEMQNNILYIHGSSTLKHAIQLKKTEIMARINTENETNKIKDIR